VVAQFTAFDGVIIAASMSSCAAKRSSLMLWAPLPEPAMGARDRVREIVKELADIGDLTSAYVRYRQQTDEQTYGAGTVCFTPQQDVPPQVGLHPWSRQHT